MLAMAVGNGALELTSHHLWISDINAEVLSLTSLPNCPKWWDRLRSQLT